jgi:hypothetical protein
MQNRHSALVALLTLCSVSVALAVPTIECAAPEHDFGVRRDHETVTHRFGIKNSGDAPLAITRVKASCGCTAVRSSKNSIPPGEEAYVEARFTLKGRRGKQRKSILVESNDPAMPRLRLWLKGQIVTELAMEPRYLNFSQVHKDVVATQTVDLVSLRPAIRITQVKSDSTAFAAVIDPDGRGLTIRTVPPLKEGFVRARMVVHTDHPAALYTDINMVAVVVGDLNVVPREVILRRSQPASRRLALRVRPFGKTPFTITKVEVPQEGVTPSTMPLANGSISVILAGIRPEAALNGQVITLHTDLPSTPLLRVPIRVLP